MLREIDGRLISVNEQAFQICDGIVADSDYNLPVKFYCGKKPKKNCCLTHLVGLPRHPATGKTTPLTKYQLELQQLVQKNKPQKYIINKGRQMGFTEIILRIIQQEALNGKYQGSKIAIIAGTNADLAKKNLYRLYQLFKPLLKVVISYKSGILTLANSTVIEAFRANEESLTGDTNYKCVFVDESAKWRLRDDSPVFNSILPIVETNNADLFLVSTPKGPIKKFHEIWTSQDSDFVKLEYPITKAINQLYDKSEVDRILSNSVEDINQEYLCQFTVGRNSIFAGYDSTGTHEEIII